MRQKPSNSARANQESAPRRTRDFRTYRKRPTIGGLSAWSNGRQHTAALVNPREIPSGVVAAAPFETVIQTREKACFLKIWVAELGLNFQNESPGADRQANWLPAPKGPFNLTMRLYAPKRDVLTGEWNPSPVKKFNASASEGTE